MHDRFCIEERPPVEDVLDLYFLLVGQFEGRFEFDFDLQAVPPGFQSEEGVAVHWVGEGGLGPVLTRQRRARLEFRADGGPVRLLDWLALRMPLRVFQIRRSNEFRN